jgi:hypothetical protein
MDFTAAFTFIFEDRQWTEKMVMTVVIAALALIPLFGLVALAALLGYVVELVQNVRSKQRHPLPRWDRLGEKVTSGGSVLVAALVYNLPLLLVSCCALALPLGLTGDATTFAGTGATLAVVCCAVPLLIAYTLVTWPMLALGTIRFADTGSISAFFQFGDLFYTLYSDLPTTARWLVFSVLANMVIGLLTVIPCLGWLAMIALVYPVQGYLLGQFALLIEDNKPGRKPKRA